MTITETIASFLLDNQTTAVLLFDQNLDLQTINTAAENLLSISSRRVLGQSVRDILPTTPFFAEAVERSFKTRGPFAEWGVDINLPNMKSITVDCTFTPILNEDDAEQIIVEMINTRTHRRIAKEENLIAQHLVAEESARALAHEIKNPLGGLRGAAQLLQQELSEDQLREYTQIIIDEADRLRNLVDRMLGPQKDLNLTNLNIHEVLEYVCNLITSEADFQFKLTRDYDPSLPNLTADREQLIQAFLNILSNAVQAINENGEICLRSRAERQITIGHKLHKLCLRIDVIDNGPGIPAEIEDNIFYPMITGRPEGTGLGLSIAQSLIQKHGGLIEYNRVDERTIFTISLPWESKHD